MTSCDKLRNFFRVNDDGLLERKVSLGRSETGWRLAPYKANHNSGYVYLQVGRSKVSYHRIIWTLLNGEIPTGMEIDHINGIRDDNRSGNLRLVDDRGNSTNLECHRKGCRPGVRKCRDKWMARINIKDFTVYLGMYESVDEANAMYVRAASLVEEYIDKNQFFELVTGRKKLVPKRDALGRIYHVPE